MHSAENNEIQQGDQLADLVDELGVVFEENGGSRMVGRVLGQLMLSSRPLQSQAELAEALHASVAAISGAARQLVETGMIERVAIRSARTAYYRMASHGWPARMDRSVRAYASYREFTERALDVLHDQDGPGKENLRRMRDYMAFMEQEVPALIRKFKKSI